MKKMKSTLTMMAVACGAMAVVSCSRSVDFAPDNLSDYQKEVYSRAFSEEFAAPASDQNWGFEKFSVQSVVEPMGSFEYFNQAGARTRAVVDQVTVAKGQSYSRDELLALKEAKCYFYLRIDNTILLQEKNGVMGNPIEDYYPGNITLDNGVRDNRFNTDNEGTLLIEEWQKLGLLDKNGLTYASDDQPIPESIFGKCPSFETMALHVPDSRKVEIAGSVEKFMTDYKIFWYVAKWQQSDGKIHVDGVLVPKDQITVNIPEYKQRIIVEDLRSNITEGTKVNGSDFDFNDVVFDAVTWTRDGKQHLKIVVRAAGGQLPIYVYGKEVHDGIGYMFNTDKPDYTFGKVLIEDEIIGTGDASSFDFSSIPVEIEINGSRSTAGADIGSAPEKIAVGLDYKWCVERQNIKDAYPRFVNYVSDKSVTEWWK